jgi:hypothetical protein
MISSSSVDQKKAWNWIHTWGKHFECDKELKRREIQIDVVRVECCEMFSSRTGEINHGSTDPLLSFT